VTFTETNDTVNVLDVGPHGGFWRKKRGMTQAALADAAAISQAFLSEIESGQKPGTAATLKKIADVLQLKVDDLL
jgi:transcriptional regulator with XRE-family HTH domain